MSFKSYLSALLERFVSKEDTEFIAQQSLPDSAIYSSVTIGSEDASTTVTSPVDGWAGVRAESDTSSTGNRCTNLQLIVGGTLRVVRGVYYNNALCEQWGGIVLPVSKGESVSARCSQSGGTLRFVRSVGGVLANHVLRALQGDKLCLKTTSEVFLNYLGLRRFWAICTLKKPIRVIHLRIPLILLQLTVTLICNDQQWATAVLQSPQRVLISLTLVGMRRRLLELLLLAEKAKHTKFIAPKGRVTFLGFTRPQASLKTVGGAL